MDNEVTEGQLLAGKYRIERVVGHGGMGYVVAAQHEALGERVAIKFLWPETLANEEAVTRFEREARAAAKIKSEYVVRVFDVGRLESGAPYIVMDYLEGEDLGVWLEQRGPLPAHQAIDFVLQTCVALADAHSLGIIHRDVKPDNLFCIRRSDGQLVIKVMDFGVSKISERLHVSGQSGMSMTKADLVLGSPLYMSPEQVRNAKDVDPRSDVWGVGVVLFELLTGEVPFGGESFGEVAMNIAADQVPELTSFNPEIPAGLQEVVTRCLQKDRRDRYPDVAALARALEPFALPSAASLVSRVERILGAEDGPSRASSNPSLPISTQSAPARARSSETVTRAASTAAIPGSAWSRARQMGSRRVALSGSALLVIALGALGPFAWSPTPLAKSSPDAEHVLVHQENARAAKVPSIERALPAPAVVPVPAAELGPPVPSGGLSSQTTALKPSSAAPLRAARSRSRNSPVPREAPPPSAVASASSGPEIVEHPEPGADLRGTSVQSPLRALDEADPYR